MNSYHVLELVGEGSFGRVYKGRKRFTGQVVALKFMPKVGRSEKELRSLKREIEIMRGLQHPNIVQLYDSFETETEVVVVTEFAEGQLFQILEDDGNLPESQVREIACQLVSALYYLHSHRILHRDMKPQNILIGKSGVVKLCDFGFARAMSVSTLVLTSIKGTPLYMSPELVEEKPYDHTADLWSLGCILYELHTGAPPFYTNSMFHLVQLIVRDQVKWPDSMSDTCTSFLRGLLTKDPQKRLSWPDLLHHPFVADGVLVLSNTNVSPLTVTPSPDVMALKLKQVAEKSVPNMYQESRLLRKVREQRENKRNPAGSDTAKKKKDGNGRVSSAMATASPMKFICNIPFSDVSDAPGPSVVTAANESVYQKIQACTKPKQRGQISMDYEQEFPSVEVGPRLVLRCSKESLVTLHRQDVETEVYWKNLVQESASIRLLKELNYRDIIPQIKSKIAAFQAQLAGGIVKDLQQIHQPLKVVHNLILTPDLDMLDHIGYELQLPRLLFDLIRDSVGSPGFTKHQWSIPVLGEMITVLLIYWGRHCDWVEEEPSLQEFTKPFNTILSQPNLIALAPLAASVLSLFTQHIDVVVDLENITSLLKTLLLDSCELQISPPSGWGLYDGLLSLLLHTLYEHENAPVPSCLDSVMFVNLWKTISTSLASGTTNLDVCSANGLHSFLSVVLFVFTKDPYSCIPLFSDSESKCVHTLGQLLGDDGLDLFTKDTPWGPAVELTRDSLSSLICLLLCFPFALDLPSHTLSTVLQLYDSFGIVSSLLQVIQTLPSSLLELPLSLLSRLLLCDCERSVSQLKKAAAGFFSSPLDIQPTTTTHQTPLARTASSLLSDLLQQDVLWDSAVELLTLLSQVARCNHQPDCPQLYVQASVLQQALTHSFDRIKAATCRLLGNLDPFRPPTSDTLLLDLFKGMIDCLCDSSMPVRRVACRAVGNWLGYIAVEAGFKTGMSDGNGTDTTGSDKENEQNKHLRSRIETGSSLATIEEQKVDDEEWSKWMEEASRSVSMLAVLLTDPDALTRRHCCAALGNLVKVDGAVSLLLEEDVSSLLLQAACTDPHNAVRQAAIATLSLYREQDAICQVRISHDATLFQASQHVLP
ncbi:serine/threonine-protein kinase 36 isoform X2 [Melanotaenia boesemani]|uniref:serine/threonine-protein kinase 36 isoform X2 n=1 Tax=Melanotaenia boesemani TaxID=1250792 RepID=UPI001C04DB83|nr:serine/threonine-protein kinase 36 isoform X2 [Melanotaenia boesemani]